ncbi:hypothetical protein FSP39_020495 [Pinctada imbricata]|uniref:Leucine-rich repeat-containing protein 56 n=1 Tax=Pinctada imbricata TaxID=66713 RepID=A0AA89C8B7_PINIB|nr:hypothetical protein FSP39_020495 [Pinctada imbricata]
MSAGLDERPPSALARGVQITEFKETRVNPEPIILEDSDLLLEQYLSPGKLKLLTGVQDLESVRCLEIKVNTSDTSLGNFGSLLPNLTQLKLSNSLIRSIRDLGSSLRNLTVLWMSRCGLLELDGISSMLSIKELYLSYNEICDISSLSMLDFLQILDLEGNNLDDVQQIHHLTMCSRLSSLTLEGNPVCVVPHPDADESDEYDYRLTVKTAIPQLKYLDEEPLTEEASPSKKVNVFDDDWAYLEELQKDMGIGGSMESLDQSSQGSGSRPSSTGRPGTASLRPSTGYRPGTVLRPGTGFRPMSASRRPATMSGGSVRPATAGVGPGTTSQKSDIEAAAMTDDSSSELTMGKVICGNPSKALIARRKIGPEQTQKESTELKLFPQFQYKPEHTYDPIAEDSREKSEIFDELKEWKAEHEKCVYCFVRLRDLKLN